MFPIFSDILRRPIAFISALCCLITALAVVIRLMPNRSSRKAYHVVITAQSVIDLIDVTLRIVCDSCGVYPIEMSYKTLRVISWLLTAVTAIYWMSLFFDNHWRVVTLSIVLTISALPILGIYGFFFITKTSTTLTHEENIAFAWFKAICFTIWALIVLYCLVRVILLPKSSFATETTLKGYKKVAMGLGLKTTSVFAVAITSAHDAIRQTTTAQEVPQWMYAFIDIYPATNACVTLWMVSRLLWRHNSTVVIDLRATSDTK